MLVGTVPTTAVADQILKMAGNFWQGSGQWLADRAAAASETGDAEGALRRGRPQQADRNFGVNLFSTGATNTIGTIGTQQFGPLALTAAGLHAALPV